MITKEKAEQIIDRLRQVFCKHAHYGFIDRLKIQKDHNVLIGCEKCGKNLKVTLFVNSYNNTARRIQICRKNTYLTKRHAEEVFNACKKAKRKTQPTRIYRCAKCQGWHLTSKTKRPEEYELPTNGE